MMIKHVKLYVKNTKKAHEIEKVVSDELLKNGFIINDTDYELAISIGGDGTFIKMIHDNRFNNNICYAAINAGSLGFLSSINNSQISLFIKDLKNNEFKLKKLNILKTKIFFENKIDEILSINELTIRKNDFSSLRCDVLLDENLVNKYIGDGLVISTPIGSTGYNMALGGSIIDNNLKALSITPIAPINNQVYKSLINPFIVDAKRKITIKPFDNKNISLISDGKINNLSSILKMESELSDQVINCIMLNDYNYLENIKSKIIDSRE